MRLGRLRRRTWWDDVAREMQIEKAVFLSAFIVRKLADSGRLSIQVEDEQITVASFPLRTASRIPDSWNRDRLAEFYDLERGTQQTVRVRHLVNWIIHSYVFMVEVRSDLAGSEVPEAFYCNSDRTRGNRVIRVPWASYRAMLEHVVSDDVIEIITLRDGGGAEVALRSSVRITPEAERDFRLRHQDFLKDRAEQSQALSAPPEPKA